MKRFIETRDIRRIVDITNDYRSEETPSGFRDICLLPHQCTSLAALIDWESTGEIAPAHTDSTYRSTWCRLAEPFGSGKTYILLALILHNRVPPKAYPQVCSEQYYDITPSAVYVKGSTIMPNLIICATSCLHQWGEAIANHTNMKAFVIGSYYDMVKFMKLYKSGQIDAYDIVLTKNGTFAGKLGLESDDEKGIRNVVDVINEIVQKRFWARVIVDDFDTNKISLAAHFGANGINYTFLALRTIHVSTTANNRSSKNKLFTVVSDPDYIKSSLRLTMVKYFVCTNKNTSDKIIGILASASEIENAALIAEMLNSGAIKTAADQLGIVAKTPGEIFQRVLGNQYDAYIKLRYQRDHVAKYLKTYKSLPLDNENMHTTAQVDMVIAALSKGRAPECVNRSATLNARIEEYVRGLLAEFQKLDACMQRVISSVRSGKCSVCLATIDPADNCWTLRCCGVAYCDKCVKDANQMKFGRDVITCTDRITGSCGNCKAKVYIADFICIPGNFNIDEVMKSIILPTPVIDIADIPNPKMQCLLDIISGKHPANTTQAKLSIPGLIVGRNDVPQDGVPRKVIIFANYTESLLDIEMLLAERGISFEVLHGTHAEIARTIERFRQSSTCLLVNSRIHCAGLNLQFATDIVYMHKIVDQTIETQVAGRGQRIGRQCNLHIWYLLFDNERSTMTRQYNI